MLKKKESNKIKNKNKRVHFNEEQINEVKKKNRPKSADKRRSNKSLNDDNSSTEKPTTIEDFTIIQELGSGPYSKVNLAKHNSNGKYYAIKAVNKSDMNNNDKLYEVYVEKQCLAELKHENIVKLNRLFQDKKFLYFALEYCKNKDLGKLLGVLGKLDFKLAKFYAAEILLVINYLHKHGIVHRNIIPENIGLDEYMHIKVFDFATCLKIKRYFDLNSMKFVEFDEDELAYLNKYINKLNSDTIKISQYNILLLNRLIVESPEYTSPEVLEHNYTKIGRGVDLWSFGVMLYLFFTGTTPFKAKKESKMFENIKNAKFSFDEKDDIPWEAKDLITKLLVKDPTKRIGYKSRDYFEIKNHPFFQGINFENLEFEAPPISDVKEKLIQSGYTFPKSSEENEINDSMEFLDEDNNNVIMKCKTEKNLGKKGGDEEDKVILEDTLQKKSPWLHYNTRIVKFFSQGHINYYDPNTKELKGMFKINSDCKVNVIDDYKFEIVTINRSYSFKHKSQKIANNWENTINAFISKCDQKDHSM